MKTYDPKLVDISFAGISISGGFAEGSMVVIKRDKPAFTKVTGVDGEVTRSRMHDESGSVELTLLQSSEANLLLSQRHAIDKATPGGAGVGALQIADRGGLSLHHAEEAWIAEEPEAEYAADPKERKWIFHFANMNSVHGGN